MMNLSHYPGEDDQEVKTDPADVPMDDPETEEEEDKIKPEEDPDDALLDDDGIEEGEEIE